MTSATVTPTGEPDPFATVPPDEVASTAEETRFHYWERAERGYATVRRSFLVQDGKPGPLSKLVQTRSSLPLDLYLLRLALAQVVDIERTPLRTWARMLSTSTSTVTETMVSRAVDRLAAHSLVRKTREGRHLVIELLLENGSGEEYTQPVGAGGEQYFTVPGDYWMTPIAWAGKPAPFAALKVPGKAMFLVLLSQTSGQPFAEVTVEYATKAFGFSQSTVERGYKELRELGLMVTHSSKKKAPEGFKGWMWVTYRAATHPYSQFHRDELRAEAKTFALSKAKRAKGGGDEGGTTAEKT